MASQTEGVLRLLAAEKLAAEKVSEARRRKARRLKQAKDEAEAEVNAYKSEREREYLDYETRNAGSQDDVALRIEEDTKKKIDGMDTSVASTKQAVIDDLIATAFDIEPRVHVNFRG